MITKQMARNEWLRLVNLYRRTHPDLVARVARFIKAQGDSKENLILSCFEFYALEEREKPGGGNLRDLRVQLKLALAS